MTRNKFLVSLGALIIAPFLPAKVANEPFTPNVQSVGHEERDWYKPCFFCGSSEVWWCQWDDSGFCSGCGMKYYGGERMEAVRCDYHSQLGKNYQMHIWTYYRGRFWRGDTIALV